MNEYDLVRKLREIHYHVPKLMCAAETVNEVTVLHQFTNAERPVILRCSEEFNHEGMHKDAVCCWNFHKFDSSLFKIKNENRPRDVGECACGSHKCATLGILTRFSESVVTDILNDFDLSSGGK